MSTNYLPSIFHGGKSKTLSKRSTITSTKPLEEMQPSHPRSTTISKVKRFGSLLVRSNTKNDRRRRADTIFPPQIDTNSSAWSSTQESLVSSTDTNISTDDDEEEVMTPTSSMVSHMFEEDRSQTAITNINSSYHSNSSLHHSNSMVVTPSPTPPETIETNQSVDDKAMTFDDKEITKEEQPDPEPKIIDPDTLSSVSLVRYHLEMAMAEIDQEIDDELEAQREHMLKNIQARPTLSF
ncbi:hypothetical protein BD770DRAFT_381539 [Pilaira anomala]|nr:hypothetical protein BD770DRAFT_381539 [Pilaira anomala]